MTCTPLGGVNWKVGFADFDRRLDLAEAKAGSVAQDIVKGELQGQEGGLWRPAGGSG